MPQKWGDGSVARNAVSRESESMEIGSEAIVRSLADDLPSIFKAGLNSVASSEAAIDPR